MRIAIDLTPLLPGTTGMDRYLRELAIRTPKADPGNQYTILVNAEDRNGLAPLLAPNASITRWSVRAKSARLVSQQALLPVASWAGRFDVVHSPSFLMPMVRGRSRHLLTVADMTFFSMPEVHSRLHASWLFRAFVSASIRRADMINVLSAATRSDLLRLFPAVDAARVRVTPLGVDERFCPASPELVASNRERLKLPARYVLFVGTLEPRKNVRTLVNAYRRLVESGEDVGDLVLAGARGWNSDELFRDIGAPSVRSRIHVTGRVPEADLPWVYRGAQVFVYPPLYEGFGLPPLEAMACGVPVITASNSSLSEIFAGAAELVAAHDSAAIATAIQRVQDVPHRNRLVQAGLARAAAYSWDATARGVAGCYHDLSALS